MDIDNFIIGKSKNIVELKLLIKKVAPTGSTVLILGETWTWKELVAEAYPEITWGGRSWLRK